MGEFGAHPEDQPRGGRDHWPRARFICLAGAGIRGGQVIGKTDPTGGEPAERPVTVEDVATTLYTTLGIDSTRSIAPPPAARSGLRRKGRWCRNCSGRPNRRRRRPRRRRFRKAAEVETLSTTRSTTTRPIRGRRPGTNSNRRRRGRRRRLDQLAATSRIGDLPQDYENLSRRGSPGRHRPLPRRLDRAACGGGSEGEDRARAQRPRRDPLGRRFRPAVGGQGDGDQHHHPRTTGSDTRLVEAKPGKLTNLKVNDLVGIVGAPAPTARSPPWGSSVSGRPAAS